MSNKRLKIARFESIVAKEPEDREALTQLGLLHESLEEYEKAINFFERCLRVDNKDPDVLASTAYCYLRTEDLAKALATYQRALFLLDNKATPKILYGLGVLYDRNEKFDTAKSTFEQLCETFPEFDMIPEVQLRLGGVCKLLGQYDDGLKWLQLVLDADMCPPPFAAEDVWFEIAQLYCLQSDFHRAEEAYNNSGRGGESRESEQWCNLGRNYSALQEYRQAFNAYNEAISLEPQSWSMWRCMGDLYSRLNQQNDALDAFQRVTELNPAAAEVWYDMGVILEASKRFPQAINAFERVLDIEPTNGDVRARLERLRGIAPKRPKREAAVLGARMQSRQTRSSAPPPNSLHQAVADGNVARLRDLLSTASDKHEPNMFDWGGKTPLHWAALNAEAEMAELLLTHGATSDTKDRLGRTPLHCAALCGAVDVARTLLEHGADASASSFVGWCAMHFAAEGGNAALVEVLYEHHPQSIWARNDKLSTPLDIAKAKRHTEATALLEQYAEGSADPGAQVALQNRSDTPIAEGEDPNRSASPVEGEEGAALATYQPPSQQTMDQVSKLRQEQGRLHETGLRKDQEIAVLQKEVRRLAVENSAVSEEVWKQLEEAERELATARIDLEACRFKISDLEKELDGSSVKARQTQGDLRGEVQRLQKLLGEVEHLEFEAKAFDKINAEMIVSAGIEVDDGMEIDADADPALLKDLLLSLQAKLYVSRSEQARFKKVAAQRLAELQEQEDRWNERERQAEAQLNAVLSDKVELHSQLEKLKLQNSFLEKQLARRISVIDEVKRENEALLKAKQIAEIQTQDLASEVKQLTERVEESLERERAVTFEKHKAEDLLHRQTKRVAALEEKAETLEKQKAELSVQVGQVDVRYEEMQAEYRKLRARLEKHELLTELSMSKEQALLLTELTKKLEEEAGAVGVEAARAPSKQDDSGEEAEGAPPSEDGAAAPQMKAGKIGGKTAWSELDSELETQLRNQVKIAQESMHDAHKRLALKHVKNEALIGQLHKAEEKLETAEGELKESKRLLEQAERRFSKRLDTKSKLVDELKEELTEKDRRLGAALQEVRPFALPCLPAIVACRPARTCARSRSHARTDWLA